MIVVRWIGLLAAAYLLGSLPFAVWIGRLTMGKDIRDAGSGHAGATNVLRQAGWLPGLSTLLLDMAKGALPVLLARWTGVPAAVPFVAGLSVVGHCWPVWAGFRGGMGVSTAAGALLASSPLAFALAVGIDAAANLLLRHTARANLTTGMLTWLILLAVDLPLATVLTAAAVGLPVAFRARSDWNRAYRELWLDRGSPHR